MHRKSVSYLTSLRMELVDSIRTMSETSIDMADETTNLMDQPVDDFRTMADDDVQKVQQRLNRLKLNYAKQLKAMNKAWSKYRQSF